MKNKLANKEGMFYIPLKGEGFFTRERKPFEPKQRKKKGDSAK